jgi:kynurenine formamidase
MIWLSFPLDVNGPRPPAIPAPSLEPLYTIEKDGATVQILRVASHTGTHVDAPAHVIAGGLALADFRPEEFVFTRPAVMDLTLPLEAVLMPEQMEPFLPAAKQADMLLVRFGLGALRRDDPARFCTACPGFGVEAARSLRQQCPRLRCLGLDAPSLACIAQLERTMASHNELLGGPGRRFLVVEDMDLDKVMKTIRPDIVAVGHDQHEIEVEVNRLIKEKGYRFRVEQVGRFGPEDLNSSSKIKRRIAEDSRKKP